ncbi:MAG: hypothetical protein JWQ38_1746 [Flavipsychrobacter sp.]|nr:hypothetical protein [Flavipsychrobacter sp.]
MKKPFIAAILNFLFYGAGYVYNGKKKGYGIALIIAWIVLRTADIKFYLNSSDLSIWFILMAGLAILQFTFAIDGYHEAKRINNKA